MPSSSFDYCTINKLVNEVYSNEESDCSKLIGFYYNHIPELAYDKYFGGWDKFYESGLRVKTIAHYGYDSRRYWDLSLVFYKEIPIMLIQNAGREGDDHRSRYIFNVETYKQCIEDLSVVDDDDKDINLENINLEETFIVYDLDAENVNYLRFYGNDIDNNEEYDFIDVGFRPKPFKVENYL